MKDNKTSCTVPMIKTEKLKPFEVCEVYIHNKLVQKNC